MFFSVAFPTNPVTACLEPVLPCILTQSKKQNPNRDVWICMSEVTRNVYTTHFNCTAGCVIQTHHGCTEEAYYFECKLNAILYWDVRK